MSASLRMEALNAVTLSWYNGKKKVKMWRWCGQWKAGLQGSMLSRMPRWLLGAWHHQNSLTFTAGPSQPWSCCPQGLHLRVEKCHPMFTVLHPMWTFPTTHCYVPFKAHVIWTRAGQLAISSTVCIASTVITVLRYSAAVQLRQRTASI